MQNWSSIVRSIVPLTRCLWLEFDFPLVGGGGGGGIVVIESNDGPLSETSQTGP